MQTNERILAFLKSCTCYFLATVDGEKARVRPMGFALLLSDGSLCFGMGSEKRCCAQAKSAPWVELCALNAEKQWLRISGRAVFDDSPETLAEIFAKNEFLRNKYRPESGLSFAPYRLECAEAWLSAMDGSCEKWL